MFFKKLKKGFTKVGLERNEFCKVYEENADECSHEYYFSTHADNYNLLYRDGQFIGMPAPFGGKIYPFSDAITKEGSKHQKNKYGQVQLVCLAKRFNVKVQWGKREPSLMIDNATQKAYVVGMRGVFYVTIDPVDAARSGDLFYRTCVSQYGNEYTEEDLKDFLADAFVNSVGGKVQEYIAKLDRPLSNLVGLQDAEKVKISEELYPELKDLFKKYGLIMVEESSKKAIFSGLIITPKDEWDRRMEGM